MNDRDLAKPVQRDLLTCVGKQRLPELPVRAMGSARQRQCPFTRLDHRLIYCGSGRGAMKLEILERKQSQCVGSYGNVCIAVRWEFLVESDAIGIERALERVRNSTPDGASAFLQVNRFVPTAGGAMGLDEGAQAVTANLIRAYGPSYRSIVFCVPDQPFLIASMRSLFTRLIMATKVRLDLRVTSNLTEAVSLVCKTLASSSGEKIQPAALLAAVEELEHTRPVR